MRKFDQGSFVRVSFNDADAERFASRWPCSTVQGRGSFTLAKAYIRGIRNPAKRAYAERLFRAFILDKDSDGVESPGLSYQARQAVGLELRGIFAR